MLDLDADDVVVLWSARLDGEVVHDDLTGTAHRVNDRAAAVLRQLDGRHRWRDVIAADPDAGPFVAELEAGGLVRIRRRWASRLHPATWPSVPGPARQRWPATVGGIASAVLMGGRSVLAVGAACSLPLLVLMPSVAALVPVGLVAAALLTTVAHELGHLSALRLTGLPVPFVSAERGRVAISHAPGAGRLVALAGPFAGAVAAVVMAAGGARALPVAAGLAWTTGALVALGHLVSLAPGFTDGDRLWKRTRS